MRPLNLAPEGMFLVHISLPVVSIVDFFGNSFINSVRVDNAKNFTLGAFGHFVDSVIQSPFKFVE